MQEGRTENIGWSVHFDSQRDNVSLLYHTEEDKDRLCGSYCCQKSDVIFTHRKEEVAEKVLVELRKLHRSHQASKEALALRAEISALKDKQVRDTRKVLEDSLEKVKDNMLEYLI